MGNLPCMGLILGFLLTPSPRGFHHPDHSLATGVHMHVFHRDFLLALAAVAIERFEQRRVGAGQLRLRP